MKRYRKKPEIVEACLVTDKGIYEIAEWCRGTVGQVKEGGQWNPVIEIRDDYNELWARLGDYIIRYEEGLYMVVSQSYFERNYEAVP